MPKIIFQPLMIANPRDTWRGAFLLDKMVIACLPGIANPRNAWRGTLWGKYLIANPRNAWRGQISMLKVTPVFKVPKTRNILLRLRCPRSCRSWWSC